MVGSSKPGLYMSDDEVNAAVRVAEGREFGVLSADFLSQSVSTLKLKQALCVKEGDSIQKVVELLRKNKSGSVVVVESSGKLTGIFTERDCLLKVVGTGLDLAKTPIKEVMTPNPETQAPNATIAFALNLMSLGGFRHIPIVDDDGHPMEVMSVKDVVDFIVHKMNADLLGAEE